MPAAPASDRTGQSGHPPARPDPRSASTASTLVVAVCAALLSPVVLAAFDRSATALVGVPALVAYVFAVWLAVIALTAIAVRR